MPKRGWGTLICVLLVLALSDSQAQVRETSGPQNSETLGNTKLEVIAGKYYSKGECVRLARWAIHDEKRLKALTGIEVGNWWYVLDTCGFMHFSDPKTLYDRPSTDHIAFLA